MMRNLEHRERDLARQLWEEVFPEDSKEFLDTYEEIRKDNRISVWEEKNAVVSMIQWNPCEICYGKMGGTENRVTVPYVVGVATKEPFRHRGYMRQLLCSGMEEMRRSGVPFAFLMPADEAIYLPFGFRTVYEQRCFRGTRPLSPEQDAVLTEAAAGDPAFVKKAEELLREKADVYCIRDEAYFSRLVREMASEEGKVVRLGSASAPEGYYCFWPGEQPEVREVISREPEHTAAQLGLEPVTDPSRIMIRMLDIEAFVRPLRAENRKEVVLHMEDPILVENSGYFRLIVDTVGGMLEELTADEAPDGGESTDFEKVWEVTPELLTDWMFGQIELPWGEGIDRPDRIFLNELV